MPYPKSIIKPKEIKEIIPKYIEKCNEGIKLTITAHPNSKTNGVLRLDLEELVISVYFRIFYID